MSDPPAKFFTSLSDIPTIGELYKSTVPKPLPSDEIHYKTDTSLLDRISL
jgi:hypothetical protein